MSSRDNGFEEYGFLINKEQLKIVAQKFYGEDFSEKDWNEAPYEFYEGLCDHFGLRHESSFSGEAFAVSKEGRDTFFDPSVEIDNDTVIYLPLKKWSTLFEAAYSNMEEIITEAQSSEISKYLPEPFVWDLRHIVGCYFG